MLALLGILSCILEVCFEFENAFLPIVCTVYPKKYAHGFVVLCLVVVMQSFIMNSNEVFIHIHQGCFAGTGVIVRLPQCQWSKPDGCGKISQCITTTKHSKAKTVCIFLGIYCIYFLVRHDHVLQTVVCTYWFEFSQVITILKRKWDQHRMMSGKSAGRGFYRLGFKLKFVYNCPMD